MPDAKLLKKCTFFCVVEETLQVIKNLEREKEREIFKHTSKSVVQLAGMSGSSEQYIMLKDYTF